MSLISTQRPDCHLVDLMTSREKEILPLLAEGLSNREIADRLMIGYTTVKWYNQQIYDKLGLDGSHRKRRWAVHCAQKLGLLPNGHNSETALVLVGDNPYKGLDAFQTEDAHLFFGREAFVDQLLEQLQINRSTHRFLAVVGPSGSGKSSIVRAGLIPAIQSNRLPGSKDWVVATMFPGVNPFFELEAALHTVAQKQQSELLEIFQRDANGLARVSTMILPEGQPLLIIIDQFEELFTLVEHPEIARRFMDLIYAAVTDPRSKVHVIITLRADFLDRPLMYPDISWLIEEQHALVGPLKPDEMERAVLLPAQQANVTIEPAVIAKILAEAHEQPGVLPLLQFALTELFDNRVVNTISLKTYEEIGGLRQTLTRQADKVLASLDADQQSIVRQLMLRLITLGEGTEDVRRRVPMAELRSMHVSTEALEYVIQFLTANRLLTVDLDPSSRTPAVEVSHEALIREWATLRQWLDESRNDVRMQRLLNIAASEWNRHERDVSYLMRGGRLAQFRTWQELTTIVLTQLETEFLTASTEEHERQRRLQRVRRNVALAVAVAAALMMGVLALLANSARNQAELAETDARQQAGVLLAAQAESELDNGYYDRAVLLALDAIENYPYSPQAEHALGQAVSYNRALQQYDLHTQAITSIDWSPDGRRVATSSSDNTVQIWDATSGEQQLRIELPLGITGNSFDWGLTVKWLPDGDRLVVLMGDRFLLGSQDYDMAIYDANTGEQIQSDELDNAIEPIAGVGSVTSATHYATGQAVAVSANGKLATVGGNNTAIVWDETLRNPALVLEGHSQAVNSVDWSPEETRIATASEDGTVRIWDADTGENIAVLSAGDNPVNQAMWSPDGALIAAALENGDVNIWDSVTGDLVKFFQTDGGIVWSIAWSRDGAYLATGSNDAVARAWDVATGDMIVALRGHRNFISALAWSPRGDILASAGAGGIARIWNAAPSTAWLSLPYPYTGELDWSSDGRHLAASIGDWWAGVTTTDVAIWDVQERTLLQDRLFERDGWYVLQTMYAPDDRSLLIRAGTGPLLSSPLPDSETAVYIINSETGELLQTFTHNGPSIIRAADWSPDGQYIVGGLGGGSLVVWSVETGSLIYAGECGDWINSVSWAPDGSRFAAMCQTSGTGQFDNKVQVFDAQIGSLATTLHDDDPLAIAQFVRWSPDSTRIASTGGNDEVGSQNNPVIIWDANTGEKLLSIVRHAGQVWSVSWSPNGERIVSGSSDDTTRVWDSATGAELLTLTTPNNWSAAPEWSPDGQYVAVSRFSFDEPGGVEVWRVWQSTDELIAYAKDCCVFRGFTPEELDTFGLTESE
ncbi:MAG: hypothetical protein IT320_00715 [Anaerolineae bacterium]|nr:hypothetical protein [Anaerolineae bacterium]